MKNERSYTLATAVKKLVTALLCAALLAPMVTMFGGLTVEAAGERVITFGYENSDTGWIMLDSVLYTETGIALWFYEEYELPMYIINPGTTMTYTEALPNAIGTGIQYGFWVGWGTDNGPFDWEPSTQPHTFDSVGDYTIASSVFNRVLGGGTSGTRLLFIIRVTDEPTVPVEMLTPTPQPTPTPAPVVTLSAPAGLVTTERIVSVVPPAPVAGQPLHYTVQPGETLWTIAFNFYGSMQSATVNRILAANRNVVSANGNVTTGMVLTLPVQGLRDPITRTHLDSAAGLYLVQAGDTLASIANRFYGNPADWRRIHEANRARVPNANRINAGQWLVIP
jgi:LysM repeat protein